MSLTACSSPVQVVKTEYIKPVVQDLPKEPEYYPVVFSGEAMKYCLDADNARSLLKNIILMQGYQSEMRLMLGGHE